MVCWLWARKWWLEDRHVIAVKHLYSRGEVGNRIETAAKHADCHGRRKWASRFPNWTWSRQDWGRNCKKAVALSDWTGISPMRHFGGVGGRGMEFKQRKSHVILGADS